MTPVQIFDILDRTLGKILSFFKVGKYSNIMKINEQGYWANSEARWRFAFGVSNIFNFIIFFLLRYIGERNDNYMPMVYFAPLFAGTIIFWVISIRILMKFEKIEQNGGVVNIKKRHIFFMFVIPLLAMLFIYM